MPDDKWGETVKALVVLRPGDEATEAELIEYLPGPLAHFKAPTSVEFRATAGPHGHREAPEVQAPPALLGGPDRAG